MNKLVYALANPVKDHLVAHASEWPGVSSLAALESGEALRAKRPRHFFRDDGSMPPTVQLVLVRPPGFEHLSQEEFARTVKERIATAEATAASERARSGGRVLGRSAVLAQRWQDRPRSQEPRRQLDPRVAARNKWRRIEALLQNRAFRDAYTVARTAFVRGIRNIPFPPGTWWLRRFAFASCAEVATPTAEAPA
jgi:hypothetical protein